MRVLRYIMVAASLLLAACATTKKTSTVTSNGGSTYSEDLSAVRPKIEPVANNTVQPTDNNNTRRQTTYVEPTMNVNKQLDAVLDSIKRINLDQNQIEGFTIQIYSGAKREEALNVKKQISSSMPETYSEIQYVQPNFRVKVGKYNQRIDAQKDYNKVRQYFPNAIVIPERIAIN